MSWLSSLFARRVPQYLVVYLAACWGVVQFVDFLVERYLLSPYLTDLCLLGAGLLLPSVVLLTFNHGGRGPDRIRKSELIVVPTNLVLAAGVLVLLFSSRDLGAQTRMVTVTDEEGAQVQRQIPRAGYRRHLAVFLFDSESDAPETRWLPLGLSWGLAADLNQDIFVDLRSPSSFVHPLERAGFPRQVGVPLGLKRQLSEEQHRDHFVVGSVRKEGEVVHATVAIYETKNASLVEQAELSNGDVFALIDTMAKRVRKALEIPSSPDAVYLPASELLTNSEGAFREFVEGLRFQSFENDYARALEHMEKAVAIDPTFSFAHVSSYAAYIFSGRLQEALAANQQAMDNLYRLPERVRFAVRTDYYSLRQETERLQGVVQTWMELYPDDLLVHSVKAQLQTAAGDLAGAIETLEHTLELDPRQVDALDNIGDLYRRMGDVEHALDAYGRYADANPNDGAIQVKIGAMLRGAGEHDRARAALERALALSPEDVAAMVELGRLDSDLGRFDHASEQLEHALEAGRSAEDRARALDALSDYYRSRGKAAKAVELLEQSLEERKRFEAPYQLAVRRLVSVELYVDARKGERARAVFEEAKGALSPPFDTGVPAARAILALADGDVAGAKEAIVELQTRIEGRSVQLMDSQVAELKARTAELEDRQQDALEQYRSELRLDPLDRKVHWRIGRCLRRLGQLDEAAAEIQKALAIVPSDARALLELALVRRDQGKREEALELLRRAHEILAEADPAFPDAVVVRQALAELADVS